jgi:galactitol-specific phosphotransferase system IIB component
MALKIHKNDNIRLKIERRGVGHIPKYLNDEDIFVTRQKINNNVDVEKSQHCDDMRCVWRHERIFSLIYVIHECDSASASLSL